MKFQLEQQDVFEALVKKDLDILQVSNALNDYREYLKSQERVEKAQNSLINTLAKLRETFSEDEIRSLLGFEDL